MLIFYFFFGWGGVLKVTLVTAMDQFKVVEMVIKMAQEAHLTHPNSLPSLFGEENY